MFVTGGNGSSAPPAPTDRGRPRGRRRGHPSARTDLDVRDPEAVLAAIVEFGPDAIMHLADHHPTGTPTGGLGERCPSVRCHRSAPRPPVDRCHFGDRGTLRPRATFRVRCTITGAPRGAEESVTGVPGRSSCGPHCCTGTGSRRSSETWPIRSQGDRRCGSSPTRCAAPSMQMTGGRVRTAGQRSAGHTWAVPRRRARRLGPRRTGVGFARHLGLDELPFHSRAHRLGLAGSRPLRVALDSSRALGLGIDDSHRCARLDRALTLPVSSSRVGSGGRSRRRGPLRRPAPAGHRRRDVQAHRGSSGIGDDVERAPALDGFVSSTSSRYGGSSSSTSPSQDATTSNPSNVSTGSASTVNDGTCRSPRDRSRGLDADSRCGEPPAGIARDPGSAGEHRRRCDGAPRSAASLSGCHRRRRHHRRRGDGLARRRRAARTSMLVCVRRRPSTANGSVIAVESRSSRVALAQVAGVDCVGHRRSPLPRPHRSWIMRWLDLFEDRGCLNGGAGGHRLVGVAHHDRQVDQPGEHPTEATLGRARRPTSRARRPSACDRSESRASSRPHATPSSARSGETPHGSRRCAGRSGRRWHPDGSGCAHRRSRAAAEAAAAGRRRGPAGRIRRGRRRAGGRGVEHLGRVRGAHEREEPAGCVGEAGDLAGRIGRRRFARR